MIILSAQGKGIQIKPAQVNDLDTELLCNWFQQEAKSIREETALSENAKQLDVEDYATPRIRCSGNLCKQREISSSIADKQS